MKQGKTYSQDLRACLEEIKAITKKYDCGSIVTLHDGEGMSEFGLLISEPSWSQIELLKNGHVHMALHNKSKPKETGMTVNMLIHARDLAAMNFRNLDSLVELAQKHFEIEQDEPRFYPAR